MALGYAHPNKLLNELSSQEISDWLAFSQIEPIGEVREDFRNSLLRHEIVALTHAIHGKKGTKPPNFKKFILDWDNVNKEKETQSVDQMKALLRALAQRR